MILFIIIINIKAMAKKKAKARGPKDRNYVNKKENYEVAYESKRKTPAKKFGSAKKKSSK